MECGGRPEAAFARFRPSPFFLSPFFFPFFFVPYIMPVYPGARPSRFSPVFCERAAERSGRTRPRTAATEESFWSLGRPACLRDFIRKTYEIS